MKKRLYVPSKSEEPIWTFFEDTYACYQTLFEPDTIHVKNLDWERLFSKTVREMKRSKNSKDMTVARKSNFAMASMYQVILTGEIDNILKAESVFEYFLAYKQACDEFSKASEKPDSISIKNSDFIRNSLERNFFHVNPYKNFNDEGYFNLYSCIFRRAAIGIVDLCIFLPALIRDKKNKPKYTHPLAKHVAKLSEIEQKNLINIILKNQSSDADKNTQAVGKSESKVVIKATDLFMDKGIFSVTVSAYFEWALRYEPNLLASSIGKTMLEFNLPVVSSSSYDLVSLLIESKRNYFKERSNIRVRRALLLFASHDENNFLKNKVGRILFAQFVFNKNITKTQFSDGQVKKFLSEIA